MGGAGRQWCLRRKMVPAFFLSSQDSPDSEALRFWAISSLHLQVLHMGLHGDPRGRGTSSAGPSSSQTCLLIIHPQVPNPFPSPFLLQKFSLPSHAPFHLFQTSQTSSPSPTSCPPQLCALRASHPLLLAPSSKVGKRDESNSGVPPAPSPKLLEKRGNGATGEKNREKVAGRQVGGEEGK